MKLTLTCFLFFFGIFAFAQEQANGSNRKTVATNISIQIDNVSIKQNGFKVETKSGNTINSSYYKVDYAKSTLTFLKPIESDSVIISYQNYPEFITKTYKQFDKSIIVENTDNLSKIIQLRQPNNKQTYTPFDGLTTSGSISRGVTIGNNQNSVLNSELDLQITGKLNDKVSLRASIQDANIPLQESGYSQRLDEFDQVFLELFSDQWSIRAGDIDLINEQSYFASFSKRVQGLQVKANFGDESQQTNVFASGALVRGQFSNYQFTAQEGDQGPYKLQGPNGELFVLIVSGSETVYVNGVALKRGENEDYIIDYNAGEIIFNATYPVTSEMRISVDFQYSERDYSRIVAFAGGSHNSEKLNISASVYSESDSKNNPLQQNLSEEQVSILNTAGDDNQLMVASSEVPETYNENRILYKKENVNGQDVYVFSNNPDDTLFGVTFTLVGDNQGDYIITSSNAINNIYQYVQPIAGVPQGNYAPIVQLAAPTLLQIATVNGVYQPSNKTKIGFEIAGSKNDLNLFSELDDNNNNGFAGKLKVEQNLIKNDSTWSLAAVLDTDYIQQDFKTIQRLYEPEFNRDWNLSQTNSELLNTNLGNQALVSVGLKSFHFKKGYANYSFQHLNYSENFSGSKHNINANINIGKLQLSTNSNILKAKGSQNSSQFFRTYNRSIYDLDKQWIGVGFSAEENKERINETKAFTDLTQRFTAYEAFTGIGDSTNIYAEVGYKYRVNDSLRNGNLDRVNSSNTYYLDSRLIKNKKTNLSLYVNYRTLKNEDEDQDNENSLNSRLLFSQRFLKNGILWNTAFETNSGTLPQQDFTYVQVESGQGAYTWIDYNQNGIQELEEFEIAQFQDQGDYIRVLLPNQVYIKTHQNRLSQTLTLNPINWVNTEHKTKHFFSKFYNQSSYLIDRKIQKTNADFDLNPFSADKDNQLGLTLNFRNVLFFNRGKQRYTTSYTYLWNSSENTLSFGFIENNLKSHQINFIHKIKNSWLVTVTSALEEQFSNSENFSSKNFDIDTKRFNPKLSYLLNDNVQFDVFYQITNKENTINNLEILDQNKYGLSFAFSPKNNAQIGAVSGEFNVFNNAFDGNANSPVAYQMLEGLQPGKNFTWSLLAQKKLTKFLDLNLTYFGRKTETSTTIHTGNVQLKAYF
ncbi:hypothetical protein JAO71_12850 [Olleya sp. YSTF-M6]|uniref:TonB-dependent receptor n=1 Tax=Olleya sediminilitoris TaxID=2795739 RepID=A0ABS1WNL6_9FLAO|nr:hypothetical protein [Olleya sediminilitoris]MBL7560689.1 hypothetical protein [Olleya sediminilitoris]